MRKRLTPALVTSTNGKDKTFVVITEESKEVKHPHIKVFGKYIKISEAEAAMIAASITIYMI